LSEQCTRESLSAFSCSGLMKLESIVLMAPTEPRPQSASHAAAPASPPPKTSYASPYTGGSSWGDPASSKIVALSVLGIPGVRVRVRG